MEGYQSDEVLLAAIAMVLAGGIVVFEVEEELPDAAALIVVGESSGSLKLHHCFKSIIIVPFCRPAKYVHPR